MPAAKLGLDLDTRRITDSLGTPLQSLTLKRGTIIDCQMAVNQNNVAMSFSSTASFLVALKKQTDPPGTYLYQDTAVKVGWGTGTKWFFRLDLSNAEFDTILGKSCDMEVVLILPDGQIIPSLTLPLAVMKNVIVPP